MNITTKYEPKQYVYLVHDTDQQKRMITEIRIITPKLHQYLLVCGCEESWHYEYELSSEIDTVKKTGGE
jgi:hypothetical protein